MFLVWLLLLFEIITKNSSIRSLAPSIIVVVFVIGGVVVVVVIVSDVIDITRNIIITISSRRSMIIHSNRIELLWLVCVDVPAFFITSMCVSSRSRSRSSNSRLGSISISTSMPIRSSTRIRNRISIRIRIRILVLIASPRTEMMICTSQVDRPCPGRRRQSRVN